MSLFKQLWLAIIVIVLFCLAGTFTIVIFLQKGYVEEQLARKNTDAANRLALAISSGEYSDVKAELQINSLFDSGEYKEISLRSVDNRVLTEKKHVEKYSTVPIWFMAMLNIESQQGVALVTNGWVQVGQLHVIADSQLAYQQLWSNSCRLLIYFVFLAIASGCLGQYLLYRLISPLRDVVSQAESIADRRFITIEEPKTSEFKRLVRVMNHLSNRVKTTLAEQTARVSDYKASADLDPATDLFVRARFISIYDDFAASAAQSATGMVLIFRIEDLAELNALYDRNRLNELIRLMGEQTRRFCDEFHGVAGRLDGAEFVLVFPGLDTIEEHAQLLMKGFRDILVEQNLPKNIILSAATNYLSREPFEAVYTRLHQLLSDLLPQSDDVWYAQKIHSLSSLPMILDDWRELFTTAFSHDNFDLIHYPVNTRSGKTLYLESPIRLHIAGKGVLSASQFLGWAHQVGCIPRLDKSALLMALKYLANNEEGNIGVHASGYLLTDEKEQTIFMQRLAESGELAQRVWIEFPENAVYHYMDEFKRFSSRVRGLGCRLGLEHAGHLVEKLGLMQDVGLDFIKIDSGYLKNIDRHSSQQIFLQGLVSVGHSLGLLVIAEAVESEAALACVWQLGFDAATGPEVTKKS